MANPVHYLACDLGAESGRLMSGHLDSGRLKLEEVHRFANLPQIADGAIHWNIPGLFQSLCDGLARAGATGRHHASISADSWGVDYFLLDGQGERMDPTFHYRDNRTQRGMASVFATTTWERIFEETGIQRMPLNTLFQLASENPSRLRAATRILGIGDGFNHLLSGVARNEVSLASTFQLYNPREGNWSMPLLGLLGLRPDQFAPLCGSGTRLGPLLPELAAMSGLHGVEVIATCSHDTGAAVAAVPAEAGSDWAYLSSGTWSLMGVENSTPVITSESRTMNFTNEVGHGNSIRLLKNLSGLWLVQECRRAWAEEGHEWSYEELTRVAESATAFRSLVNPADTRFLSPGGMPTRIAAYCRETGQPVPETPGSFVRCALESLALLYRRTMSQLRMMTGRRLDTLHIVGGGSRNTLLNQFTADATGTRVLAGPVEATAAGNVLIQAMALNHLGSLADARGVVRRSTTLQEFTPAKTNDWEEAAMRFDTLPACG